MKQCRRCNEEALDTIRESIVRRGGRSYLVCWYRCSGCEDVSFGYRAFPEHGEAPTSSNVIGEDHQSTVSEEVPTSDLPLSV